jgi:hypothetical protein
LILQAQEDVSKNLLQIKNMLYGTSDAEPQTDIIVAQLAQELYNSNLLLLLIQNLSRIDFEVSLLRKLATGRIGYVAVSFLPYKYIFFFCHHVFLGTFANL